MNRCLKEMKLGYEYVFDPKLDRPGYDEDEIQGVLIFGLVCSHLNPQLKTSMRQAIMLMNHNEELS